MNLSYYKITQRYKNLQITHNCNKDEIIQYCNFFINCYYQKQKIKTTYNLQIKNSKLENNRFFALCVLLEALKEKSNISSHTIYKIDSTCEIKNILHNYNEKKCENMFIGLVNMHFFTIDNPQPIVKSQKKSNQAKNILDNHALILALCEIYNIKNPLFFITNSTTNIENLPIKNLQKYKDTYIKIQNMQNENLISYKHSFFFILNYMKCYDILPIALFLMCNAKEKIIKKSFKILRQLMIQRIKIKPLFKKAISQYKIKKLYKKLKKAKQQINANNLKKLRYTKHHKQLYAILLEYELYKCKKKSICPCSIDVPQITIEHILPINSTNKDNKKSTKLKHSLGNLTLLYKTTNSQIGNSCFKDKKEYYKSQNLLITQELTNYKKWNNKTIKNRIKRIIKSIGK